MYSVHPRQLIGLDEPLDWFNPPTVLVLEYDMDGVDPLLVFQVSITDVGGVIRDVISAFWEAAIPRWW